MIKQIFILKKMHGKIKGQKCDGFKLVCTLFGCLLTGLVFGQLPADAKLFNNGWSFHKGNLDINKDIINTKVSWQQIDLPNDWSIKAPFSKKFASATGYLPGGIGWYKKSFSVNQQGLGEKFFIYFGGVYKNSTVWLNGHLLGKRPNGFVSFFYELTPFLKKDGRNELLVKVDHSDFADCRWYTGSGIYRNVYLVKTPGLHIPVWGVQVETRTIQRDRAILNVNTEIKGTLKYSASVSAKGRGSRPSDIRIVNKLLDSAGRILQVKESICTANGENQTIGDRLIVNHPVFWSIEHPYLYTLVTNLLVNGREVESYKTAVGIRTIFFDSDKGFFLNGKNLKLKGVCLHDDAGSFGTAVPMALWRERLLLLKEAGCNAIRMTHNPHATGLYDLCDRLGFLVIDEAFDEWELGKHKWIAGWNKGVPGTDGYHRDFRAWWQQDLTDMIQRDRNHPSIIMWSIGNEIDYPNDPYSDPVLDQGHYPQIYGSGYMKEDPSAQALGRISRQLSALTHKLDSSRPVTAGLAAVMVSDKVGYTNALDIAGYNYQEYRYDKDHLSFPNRIIYGSENSHGYAAWRAVTEHAFVMGQFLWTGFDYLGEAGRWPDHGNEAGLIDMANYKKPEFYFRKSIWSDQPMVYLGTSRVRERGGPVADLKNSRHGMARPCWNYSNGDLINVYCYTNCLSAVLYLNGVSLGRKFQNDSTHVICWQVPYQKGNLTVNALARDNQTLTDSLITFGAPDHIVVKTHPLIKQPDEPHYYAVDIRIADIAGHTVESAQGEVSVRITSGGKLVGLENGNVRDSLSYGGHSRSLYHGRLRAYIACQKGQTTSPVQITVQYADTIHKLMPVRNLLK